MNLFSKKRKRTATNLPADERRFPPPDVAEYFARAKSAICGVVKGWRDENGRRYSVEVSALVGEDFMNIEIAGVDRVSGSNVLQLLDSPVSRDVAVRFGDATENNTSCIVVRVEARGGKPEPRGTANVTVEERRDDQKHRADRGEPGWDYFCPALDAEIDGLSAADETRARAKRAIARVRRQLKEKKFALRADVAPALRAERGVIDVRFEGVTALDGECLETLRGERVEMSVARGVVAIEFISKS